MTLSAWRHSIHITAMLGCLSMSLCSCSAAKPLQVFNRQSKEQVFSLAFSPAGQVLAIGSSAPSALPGSIPGTTRLPEGTIELWDAKTGRLSRTLRQSAWTESGDSALQVGSISFSPDGKYVVGGDNRGYYLWDLAAGRQKFNWRSGTVDRDISAGWSSDSRFVALPCMEQELFALTNGIAVIEVATGKRTAFFPVEIGYARSARISPDGRLLATAGHDCTVRVFDLASQTNILTDDVQTTMWVACFSPNGRQLVAGSSWGGVLLIYDITSEGGKISVTKKGQSIPGAAEIHQVEFTPDGKRALSNSYGNIGLWDATTWKSLKQLPNCRGRLSPDGTRVALVRDDSSDIVEIWDLDELAQTMR